MEERRLALAPALAALVALTGCFGVVKIPANLNIDPTQTSKLTLDFLGTPVVIPLHGGIQGEFDADLKNLLTPKGILATIKGNAITIAGESAKIFTLDTGTLCIGQNPDDPTVGTALINLVKGSSADIHFGGLATSTLIAKLVSGGIALGVDADDVPLKIDLGKLLKLQIDGAIQADVVTTGTIPDDVPLLAGASFTLETHLVSALNPSNDPLLADCQAFFDSL
jgi:hypothetical protein